MKTPITIIIGDEQVSGGIEGEVYNHSNLAIYLFEKIAEYMEEQDLITNI